jgi:hypothetical protein
VRAPHAKTRSSLLLAATLLIAACGDDGDKGARAAVDEDREYTEAEKAAFQNFVANGYVFSDSARTCAAREIVFTIGAERLDEIVAESIYDAFDGCAARNMIVLSAQAAVPNVRIEQSECFVEAAPGEDVTEEFVLEMIRAGEAPALPQSVVEDVYDAMRSCFTDEQLEAAGVPSR